MSYPTCSAVPSGPHITARFPSGRNGAGGMVYYFNLALHRQAADWYIRRYYTQHGDCLTVLGCQPGTLHNWLSSYCDPDWHLC